MKVRRISSFKLQVPSSKFQVSNFKLQASSFKLQAYIGEQNKMRQFFKYALFVFLCVIIAAPARAQTSGESAPAEANESETQEKKDQDLGIWWKRSPLSYNPIPSQFLYHFEAGYSFSRSEGSLTKDRHRVNTKITLRKSRFTNVFAYDFDKRNSAMADGNSVTVDENGSVSIGEVNNEIRNSKTNELSNYLFFALTKRFAIGGGMEWTKDDLQEIDDRYLYFIGLSCRVIDKPKLSLRLIGAYGYEELKYTDYYNDLLGNLVLKYKIMDEFDDGILRADKYYFSIDGSWQATDSLGFVHKANIIGDVDKKENRYIWRWELEAGLNYRIHKHVFLNINFTEKYNKEPAIGVRKRDQSTDIGIKLEF